MGRDRKSKKCRKIPVELVVCDADTVDSFDADELKTVDIAVNSKKIMKIMNDYFKKLMGGEDEEGV